MGNVLVNKEGTYYVGVTPTGRLMVDAAGGGSVTSDSHVMGYDGAAWQSIHATPVAGDYLLDVNVAAGSISIDPGEIRIGAVEIQDHNTTVRLRVPLVDGSETYSAGNDAGLLTSWVDELGNYNFGMVDSASHALRTITYGSVAFDNTNNVFLNQIWGFAPNGTTLQDASVIRVGNAYAGSEKGFAMLASTGTNWVPVLADAAGIVQTAPAAPATIYNNQVDVTTAGTAVALAGSVGITKVTVKANNSNTGNIYVGNSSVDNSSGLILEPGESVDVAIDDLSEVWIDSAVNGEGVSYIAS